MRVWGAGTVTTTGPRRGTLATTGLVSVLGPQQPGLLQSVARPVGSGRRLAHSPQ